MSWRLRPAAAVDADAVSLVASATFLETYAGVLGGADIVAHCAGKLAPADFAASLRDPATRIGVAEHDEGGAIIGYWAVVPSELEVAAPGDAELLRLYALTAFQGAGLGRAMMAQATDDARAMGARRMLVGTYWGNTRARRFYERHGFTLVGERSFQVGAAVHRDPVYALPL